MKLDVFGRHVEVTRRNGTWLVFYLGNEGKKRIATDIAIPAEIGDNDVIGYVADLCHEWASQRHPNVKKLF